MDAPNLSRAHLIQGTRIMRFQEVYEGWRERRLSQSEAAEILGVCERSFRRYSARYEDSEGDLNSLADRSSTSAATTPASKNLLANRRAATPGSRAPYRVRAWCPSWQDVANTTRSAIPNHWWA